MNRKKTRRHQDQVLIDANHHWQLVSQGRQKTKMNINVAASFQQGIPGFKTRPNAKMKTSLESFKFWQMPRSQVLWY